MPEKAQQFNIVLLGKTGSGKSASGNTILKQKTFRSVLTSKAITKDIKNGNTTIDGTQLTVYDTPGLFDTERNNDSILTQWESLLQLDQLGPTVYLLVIRLDRFTDEQIRTVQLVEEFLGERRIKNTWILFTWGDQLERTDMTIEEFIGDNEDIDRVVGRYEGRYHVFDNTEKKSNQVKELIEKITKAHKGLDPELPPPPPQITLPKRRLVLLGKTGAGKSASGNTILGEERFHSELSFTSVSKKSEVQQAVVAGRLLSVVDTPGLYDTNLSAGDIVLELARSIYECPPGPHALLIVLPLTVRFTQHEQEIVEMIKCLYGKDVVKYTTILFSYGEQLGTKTIEQHIDQSKELKDLVSLCGGRYHVFNNKDKRNRRQVTDLLEKIDKMVNQNGGSYYTNEMLEDATRCRAEETDRRKRETEEAESVKKKRDEQQMKDELEKVIRETEERVRREKEEEFKNLRMNDQNKIVASNSQLKTESQAQEGASEVTQSSRMAQNQVDQEKGTFEDTAGAAPAATTEQAQIDEQEGYNSSGEGTPLLPESPRGHIDIFLDFVERHKTKLIITGVLLLMLGGGIGGWIAGGIGAVKGLAAVAGVELGFIGITKMLEGAEQQTCKVSSA